jgi:hypothetical protein
VDEQKMKTEKFNIILENENIIWTKLVQLTKDEIGFDFPKTKEKYIKEWRANKLKVQRDTGMRLAAMQQGKDP